jgi:NAD(P)-dependent dehydrogenase (short-subunit alcohol dehydrogenase family)
MSNVTVEQQSKIAIVTGGSRGLGRNTAIALAHRGTDIILTYHSNEAEAASAVAQIEALGRKAIALQLDVGDVGAFGGFVERVETSLESWQRDRFDHLVNNAGIGGMAPFLDTTEAQFDALVAVHFKGVFFLTQKLLPLIVDGGRIINISSGLTRFCMPDAAVYAAMKGAVEVLTRYWAKELGPRGIAVNSVAPGAIETDFGGGIVRDYPDVRRLVASVTAMGRPGVPDDIGPMIASLLSEDNRWVTGERIEVSGGMCL